MNREYSISSNRRVIVDKKDGEFYVTIEEIGSETKSITLPAKRWAALVAAESNIDHAVSSLQAKQYVKYNHHLGGGMFVSVTTGFLCVDLRSFYYNKAKASPAPTKRGIALILTQWEQLKEINQQIIQHFPKLAKTELCIHPTFNSLINCIECHPYKDSVEPVKSTPMLNTTPENFSFY